MEAYIEWIGNKSYPIHTTYKKVVAQRKLSAKAAALLLLDEPKSEEDSVTWLLDQAVIEKRERDAFYSTTFG